MSDVKCTSLNSLEGDQIRGQVHIGSELLKWKISTFKSEQFELWNSTNAFENQTLKYLARSS